MHFTNARAWLTGQAPNNKSAYLSICSHSQQKLHYFHCQQIKVRPESVSLVNVKIVVVMCINAAL